MTFDKDHLASPIEEATEKAETYFGQCLLFILMFENETSDHRCG